MKTYKIRITEPNKKPRIATVKVKDKKELKLVCNILLPNKSKVEIINEK